MEYDFVIRDNTFSTFYYYLNDMEYGGWQTGSIIEADGYGSKEAAEREIADSRLDAHVCERVTTARSV